VRENHERGVQLGEAVRAVRQRQALSVRELARRVDVSPSLISRIENGTVMPSVATLFALQSTLDVPMSELLGDDSVATPRHPATVEHTADPNAGQGARTGGTWRFEPGGSQGVQRAAGRQTLDLGAGVHWERLTPGPDPVQFTYSVYRPGGASSDEQSYLRHSGREYGYVVSGQLSVTLAFETFHLDVGDSIAFDSSVPHRLFNEGDVDVVTIWVAIPV
jgi:transcriptional regulator with XRE-family HTH domain